jgi:hypothetical protein
VLPVRYEQGFYISGDDILQRFKNPGCRKVATEILFNKCGWLQSKTVSGNSEISPYGGTNLCAANQEIPYLLLNPSFISLWTF